MNARRYNEMMAGLIQTAIEKQCVLGSEDAAESIQAIRLMIEDLQFFWNSEETLTNADWLERLDQEMGRFEKEERA